MATNSPSISKYQIRQIILYLSRFYFLFLMPCYGDVDAGSDTLLQGQQLRDGEYLSSANKIFRLEFFNSGSSQSKYLGIFYNQEYRPHPVWVANRNNPVPNLFVMLMIDTTDGLLKISHRGGNTTISNSTPSAKNTSATILDNGNLVLRMLKPDGSINRTLWQSFDYPTDTLVPGMKLGINFRKGHNWSITSWISDEVPASGSFTLGGDPKGSSQLVIWWKGSVYWTSGLWDKGKFKNPNFLCEDLNFTYVSNENEKYLTYSVHGNISFASLFILSDGGITTTFQESEYQVTAASFDACSISGNLAPGCVMDMSPKCRNADDQFRGRRGFVENFGYIYENQNLSLLDCKAQCWQNCSCIGFTFANINGSSCRILNKATSFSPSEEYGEVVYFLHTGRGRRWWIWLVAAVCGSLLLLSKICCIKRKNFKGKGKENTEEKALLHELADTNIDRGQYAFDKKMDQVHLFSLESLEMATNKFSIENKLGEGGFGSVYKGKLPSGQEIAIKRLSRSSGQGLLEFKNEILLIAKLQHNNLVKLLGCCIEGQEKILVYEYMPNRSLDFFLFNPSGRELIKWTNRRNIIDGVAQGLLYLHKYSRLRVIHRDLKASNILLDQDMNPKISDFGMARIFGKQESEANTNRIVGTHGYMSPEYAIKGVFSVKSDVFSFGVLLLEIVSGKKIHGCYHSERPLNLIGLAWELWVEGRSIELMDSILDEYNHKNEILRYINVGLLCVQDSASDRRSMTEVITMLTNEFLPLPQPKQPAFFTDTSIREAKKEVDVEKPCTNDMSISVMEGR